MKIFTTVLTLFLSVSILFAETDSLNTKFGVYGGLNFNSHTADFYKLRGIPNCCPNFESGSGIGFNFGALVEYKLTKNWWLGGRAGVMSLNGKLTKEETTTILLENGPALGVFEHNMTGKFLNLALEPAIIYKLFGNLLVSIGARLGLNLTKDFEQVEKLTKPEGVGTFLDSLGNDTHKRTRNEYSGEIPDANAFQMSLLGSLSYELPLNAKGNLVLAPEISYYFPITELVQNTRWKVSNIKAGIALKYVPIPKPPRPEIFRKEYRIDTIQIQSDIVAESRVVRGIETSKKSRLETENEIITTETILRTDTLYYPKKYLLTGNITAVGVDTAGREIPNPVFKIEEYVSNRLDPLLNYIFFEENSSELPERYIRLSPSETSRFEIDSLYRETTIDIYHNILNIVGKRMREHPNAKITLIGCNSGINLEKNNIALSKKRAETVKEYLVNVWSISPDRIIVKERNLPEKASTPIDEPDKIAENRRVEIYSDEEEILKPVFIEKIDRTATPPIARFKPSANSEAGLKNWEVEAWQNSAPENKFIKSGDTLVPQFIDWKMEQYQKIIPKSPEPIYYSLKLVDVKNSETIITQKTLPVEVLTISKKRIERIGDYEIEKFSLILFDFDKADIKGNNQKIIEFISSRIKPESEIEIKGYTDRTGDEAYNQKLSERRAIATKNALKRSDALAKGIGEQELLYDNDLPEGRFYCRTVQVIVKTKVK
jgi:outer membrane protein OmpA-like peptidoglycan-associated protein